MQGPKTTFAQRLHAEKYRAPGETFREAMSRIAGALTADTTSFQNLRQILLDMRFMPGGRIQAAVGSTKNVTPYNCFVSGKIEDSFVSGHGSIMDRAKEAAQTMRMGGGIGYDFSTLRPRGARIKKLGSHSSGPIAFMDIFDAVCRCTASSGHRRGAQMGVLRVDHPDVEEFIHSKQEQGRLTGFNISLAVTDDFMRAVEQDEMFPLQWGGEVYREVKARNLWDAIMRSTWDWAEPGVLFIDRIKSMNNLHYCEEIVATNPCGEQPLPPHGACLLGSFNLTRYVAKVEGSFHFDFALFRQDIPRVVEAMDMVVDVATYPLEEQEREAHSKRRMGLGVTGLANAIEAIGFPYGSEGFLNVQRDILTVLRDEAYLASALLAQRKGSFPAFNADKYMAGQFINTLPPHVRREVARGVRNSHLLSIAPTGTISMCADNISSGIEPVFSHKVEREVIMPEGKILVELEDYGVAHFGVEGRTVEEVTPREHLDVLAVASDFVDSSVSKTINVPESTSWEDFKGVYTKAWALGAKGCTTFRAAGKRMAMMEAAAKGGEEAEEEAVAATCRIDRETGRRECD